MQLDGRAGPGLALLAPRNGANLCMTVIATQIQPRAVNGEQQNLSRQVDVSALSASLVGYFVGMMVRHTVANRDRLPDGSRRGRRVFSDVRGDDEDTAFVRLEAQMLQSHGYRLRVVQRPARQSFPLPVPTCR